MDSGMIFGLAGVMTCSFPHSSIHHLEESTRLLVSLFGWNHLTQGYVVAARITQDEKWWKEWGDTGTTWRRWIWFRVGRAEGFEAGRWAEALDSWRWRFRVQTTVEESSGQGIHTMHWSLLRPLDGNPFWITSPYQCSIGSFFRLWGFLLISLGI